MGCNLLPEGYLAFCSVDALESLALERMNQAANLRMRAKELLSQLVEAEADVRVTRWILEKRRSWRFRGGLQLVTEPVPKVFGDHPAGGEIFLVPARDKRIAAALNPTTGNLQFQPRCRDDREALSFPTSRKHLRSRSFQCASDFLISYRALHSARTNRLSKVSARNQP